MFGLWSWGAMYLGRFALDLGAVFQELNGPQLGRARQISVAGRFKF